MNIPPTKPRLQILGECDQRYFGSNQGAKPQGPPRSRDRAAGFCDRECARRSTGSCHEDVTHSRCAAALLLVSTGTEVNRPWGDMHSDGSIGSRPRAQPRPPSAPKMSGLGDQKMVVTLMPRDVVVAALFPPTDFELLARFDQAASTFCIDPVRQYPSIFQNSNLLPHSHHWCPLNAESQLRANRGPGRCASKPWYIFVLPSKKPGLRGINSARSRGLMPLRAGYVGWT